MVSRLAKFFFVGLLGFAVQLAALALLVWHGWSWLPATIVAVECAIVHNYVWHRRWTWSDRSGFARPWSSGFATFAQFNAATAATSIVGNVVLMAVLVGVVGMPVIAANAAAVVVISLANFMVGDRWVFGGAVAAMCLTAVPAQAGPRPDTLAAWDRYVAQTETRLAHASAEAGTLARTPTADGTTIDVDSGTISHWRGSVLLRGVSLDDVLQRLQQPGTPPPQEDVVASKVLERRPDSLRLYIRLVRHAIVTVTYDTEHDMRFTRLSPTAASARSVATRIDEVGGGDKGFLWRLNSYWQYRQIAEGVAVSVESLTLSREVPFLVRPIAGRIVPRIARESMLRTLVALSNYFS